MNVFLITFRNELSIPNISRNLRRLEKDETGQAKFNVELKLQGSLLIRANEHELRNALINILFNVFDAMPKGGTVKLMTMKRQEFAILTIKDTGVGMGSKTLSRLFIPFFTTKADKGPGPGMVESKTIIEKHNDSIKVESSPGLGTNGQT